MRDNPGAGQCRNPFRGAEFEACPSEHQRTAHGGARAWRPSGECDGNLPQHVRWLAGLQTRPKSRFSSLKESHGDEKRYYNEKVGKLQREYQKLQDRIDAMYVDKPDGRVSQEFFDRKNSDWRADQAEILHKIEKHQNANCSYLEEGVRFLRTRPTGRHSLRKTRNEGKTKNPRFSIFELPLERWRSDPELPKTL